MLIDLLEFYGQTVAEVRGAEILQAGCLRGGSEHRVHRQLDRMMLGFSEAGKQRFSALGIGQIGDADYPGHRVRQFVFCSFCAITH